MYIRSWCRVVVASQYQAGTSLYSSRVTPDWLIVTVAYAVVLVNATEVGIAVVLRAVRVPNVLGDLLDLAVRC